METKKEHQSFNRRYDRFRIKQSLMSTIINCRSCKSKNLIKLFNLGNQNFTGIFLKNKKKIPKGKLELVLCNNCSLVQLNNNFNLNTMYGNTYGYRTGLNSFMVEHIKKKVVYLSRIARLNKKKEIVLDIGSNDGTLLNSFSHNKNLNLIGIDPTIKKFKNFYKKRIKKINDFFTYKKINKYLKGKKPKVVTSIAMFYDLLNPINFAHDIYKILDKNGIWHLEQSYSGLMLKKNSYDTICHEHLEYYSLKSIKSIFDKTGFKIIDIQFNDINGGSFALTLAKKNSKYLEAKKLVSKILSEEKNKKINTAYAYKKFFNKIKSERKKLLNFLKFAKKKNKIVLGYGASTKGNVILQFCKINKNLLKNICEVNKDKRGAFTPGSQIEIISEKKAKEIKPDYFLVLPWHFKKFILNKEKKLIKKGVKFVFPLPKFEVV